MAVNLVSPGVSIREVDLTQGSITQGIRNTAVIAGPFERGPINYPTLIESEKQLLEVFGAPKIEDDQNEYWLSASNYLSYGGSILVVRSTSSSSGALNNSNIGIGTTSITLRISNPEDYLNNRENDSNWLYAAKNPGTWANGIKVAVIDNFADQRITGVSTTTRVQTTFNVGVTTVGTLTNGSATISGINTTGITPGLFVQEIVGVVQESLVITVGSGSIVISNTVDGVGVATTAINFGTITSSNVATTVSVGMGITQSLVGVQYVNSTNQVTTVSEGFLRGVITGVGNSHLDVKVLEVVQPEGITKVDYRATGSTRDIYSFSAPDVEAINIVTSAGIVTNTYSAGAVSDWYDLQKITTSTFDGGTDNSTIFWKSVAPKPRTSQFASSRNCKNDEIHIVVVDDNGRISGSSGTVLEKFLNLSKSTDGRISPSESIYYKDYIRDKSRYIYVGAHVVGTVSDFSSSTQSSFTTTSNVWGIPTQNSKFSVVGAKTYTLASGTDYTTISSSPYSATLADVLSAYSTIENPSDYEFDFIICGPSGGSSIVESIAKANTLISIAEKRKDCIVTISPHKSGVVNVSSSDLQTTNIIEFFNNVSSSSYAVLDSGYKYTFDRFNNRFVYLPCSSDVAGLMARTSINNYPWFSPAGTNRGVINNVVKLAYNPSQDQRDSLYTKRINPIISSPGAGFILFGDKTALAYASAFDRINVRQLFLTIERSIEQAARAQLFEFNDAITRSNFINIVEPYLRDVKAKRGISEFLVVCDETNNTPDIIDANEFKGDVYIKPARSINFAGLTFVATRTGVSFSEIVGRL